MFSVSTYESGVRRFTSKRVQSVMDRKITPTRRKRASQIKKQNKDEDVVSLSWQII